MRRLLLARLLVALSVLLASIHPASAQDTVPHAVVPLVELDAGNAAIRRTNSLFTSAAQAGSAAADLGLDALFGPTRKRRGVRGGFERLARLWFVNLPIASLAHGAAHDYGHFARLDELGVHTRNRDITIWPWPVPLTVSKEYVPDLERLSSADLLAALGGGEQAATAMRQAVADKIYSNERVRYFDAVLLGYAALDFTAYTFVDLGVSERSSRFFFDGRGDVGSYAQIVGGFAPAGEREARIRDEEQALRRAAWVNLLDFSLVAAVETVGRYLATGEASQPTPSLRLGRLRVAPGMHATLTSVGRETGLDVRLLSGAFLSHVKLRRMVTPSQRTLWGVGTHVRSRQPQRFLPEFRVDLFERENARAGARIEAGVRGPLLRKHLGLSAMAGYKTSGYLADAPQRAGALFSVGVSVW